MGLSCYYSYDGDTDNFLGYTEVGASEAFKYLYDYELTGELTDEGAAYIEDLETRQENSPRYPPSLLDWTIIPCTWMTTDMPFWIWEWKMPTFSKACTFSWLILIWMKT